MLLIPGMFPGTAESAPPAGAAVHLPGSIPPLPLAGAHPAVCNSLPLLVVTLIHRPRRISVRKGPIHDIAVPYAASPSKRHSPWSAAEIILSENTS
jgi:hypothetical protein